MSAPERVRTKDGMVWVRRAETRGGLALYALEGVCRCPAYVMATLEELAEHGIQSAAPGDSRDVAPQVEKLRSLLAGQRAAVEGLHEGPPHHSYRLGRDLPGTGGAR